MPARKKKKKVNIAIFHCGFIYSGGGERIVLEQAKGFVHHCELKIMLKRTKKIGYYYGIAKYSLALACFVVSLGVYYLTMYPGVAAGDSTEMVVAAYVLGVPHQPGYPLNTLLGYVFKNLPIPVSEVTRINMTSAFLQSLGVFLFYWLMLELIMLVKSEAAAEKSEDNEGRMRILNYADCLAAFTAALVLGFSLIYWEYATRFEVFPLIPVLMISMFCIFGRALLIIKSTPHPGVQKLILTGLKVHHPDILLPIIRIRDEYMPSGILAHLIHIP